MSNTPSTPAPQPPTTTLPPGLNADAIDVVPVLSAILSRIPDLTTTSTTTAGSPPAATPSQLTSGTGPLSRKDILPATDELKHKLQNARRQVKELPDIERSIEEQEEEIRELEAKVRKQREVLEELRELGRREIGESDVMDSSD